MTAVEVRIPSLLGEHKVMVTSLAQIDRSITIERTRIRQVQAWRAEIAAAAKQGSCSDGAALGDARLKRAERASRAACDALLDARLAWIEADMERLVDAWGQMPDFRALVGQPDAVGA